MNLLSGGFATNGNLGEEKGGTANLLLSDVIPGSYKTTSLLHNLILINYVSMLLINTFWRYITTNH